MRLPKIEECWKGDITTIETCIERSSANNHQIWITMWKNEYEHFQVTLIDNKKQGDQKYTIIQKYTKDYALAQSKYLEACDDNGCNPYP